MVDRAKTSNISLRLAPELRARVEQAIADHPYRPSLTAVIERGLELAMVEMASQSSAGRTALATKEGE